MKVSVHGSRAITQAGLEMPSRQQANYQDNPHSGFIFPTRPADKVAPQGVRFGLLRGQRENQGRPHDPLRANTNTDSGFFPLARLRSMLISEVGLVELTLQSLQSIRFP